MQLKTQTIAPAIFDTLLHIPSVLNEPLKTGKYIQARDSRVQPFKNGKGSFMVFTYMHEASEKLVRLTSFDLQALYVNDKNTIEDFQSTQESEKDIIVSQEFNIISEKTDASKPKQYSIFMYEGYDEYKIAIEEEDAEKAQLLKTLKATAIKSQFVNNYSREFTLSANLLSH